ncbi:MAG: hypothetical protein H6662_18025 [Ardenticatenaceae bacterium]|nr:hypothetical protein [Ardenticatenaceae bacterium]MCB9003787.1 hypothetical protein [Ardenticatenaceae bacterium]
MIAYRNDKIDNYLQQVRLGIENGRNIPDIAAALAIYGTDSLKMDAGAALFATAEELQAIQVKEYSEQYSATAALTEAWHATDKTYSTHRKLAKLALRDDPEAQAAIFVNQPKKKTLDAWLGQAGVFYKNLLGDADMLAAMGQYNITHMMLTEAQTAVVHVANLNAAQEKEKSEAQKATKTRDAALDALDEWYSEFRTLARIALEDDPQLLEALGLGAIP